MAENKLKVTILIPCRNEVNNIESCMRNVFDFDPPEGGFEVIVMDGISDDGTREILGNLQKEFPRLSVIDNPQKTVPNAMNLGIMQAKGEYIIRTDVRCIHPKSYMVDLIRLSEETNADNVGGVLVPEGSSYVQKSIASAYKSPIAMGGALRDRGDFVGETDAVYGGCFRRQRLIEVGMYDKDMVRNQDDELSFRLRKLGGKIIQSGKIKIKYYPRSQYKQLFKQFFQYGYWKVAVLKRHPKQVSWRHFAPAALVLIFLALIILSLFSNSVCWILSLFSGSYFLGLSLESLRIALKDGIKLWPGIFLSILSMHVGFGNGFIVAMISRFFDARPKMVETLSR